MLIRNLEYKKKYILICSFLILLLIFAYFLIQSSFASYESESNINLKVDNALYVFEEKKQNFNLELEGIIPRDDSYIYSFSIANYNENKESDVDIQYSLELITTTNMPLQYKLYRNEDYKNSNSTNIISENSIHTDEDNSWYRKLSINEIYEFKHNVQSKDIYYLVVDFPKRNREIIDYADLIENVEVRVDSKQVIE